MIDATYWAAPTDTLAEMMDSWRILDQASTVEADPAIRYAILTDEELLVWEDSIEDNSSYSRVSNPRAVVSNGRNCTIAVNRQRPFVVGLRPVESRGPQEQQEYHPIVRVLDEGTTLSVTPFQQADGQVLLVSDLTWTGIGVIDPRHGEDRSLVVVLRWTAVDVASRFLPAEKIGRNRRNN